MAENELSPEMLDELMGTKVKTVSSLPPAGKYPVEVVDVNFYGPSQWDNKDKDEDDKDRVEASMVVTLANLDDPDAAALKYRVKIYGRYDKKTGERVGSSLETATERSKYGQLLAALWPDEDERKGQDASGLIGERCLAMVSHQPNPSDPSKTYASVALRPDVKKKG